MAAPLLVAKNDQTELALLPALANRHGLITGATGTGKSVTLQSLAQRFSSIGVPVFMADVKGDLSGLAKAGGANPKVAQRLQQLKLAPESQGGAQFFGEPMLEIADLMRSQNGKGVVSILAAEKLMNSPKLYATFLLWMLAELFEHLPEVGDPEQPKLVFFFDEAHLLFDEAPKALLEKIEQVVRLIRSKGVGVYFVTQNPLDLPESVLGQLGNRVQHALRAFTPKDQKAVKTAADTLRPNPAIKADRVITELEVGEALVSLLDEKGRPNMVERAFIVPPASQLGPITDAERAALIQRSALAGKYDKPVDRESAYEKLTQRTQAKPAEPEHSSNPVSDILFGKTGPRGGRQSQGILEAMGKSAARSIGSELGREVLRGLLGSVLGGKKR